MPELARRILALMSESYNELLAEMKKTPTNKPENTLTPQLNRQLCGVTWKLILS